jgi:hypothetical protein
MEAILAEKPIEDEEEDENEVSGPAESAGARSLAQSVASDSDSD